MHANHYMQNYDTKSIPVPLGSCINEIYAKFWSRNIQRGITNDGLLHSGFQHQLVVLNHFVCGNLLSWECPSKARPKKLQMDSLLDTSRTWPGHVLDMSWTLHQ